MFEVQIVNHWEDMSRWMHMYVWLRLLGSDRLCLFILVEIDIDGSQYTPSLQQMLRRAKQARYPVKVSNQTRKLGAAARRALGR
jgi:hypothetical protein